MDVGGLVVGGVGRLQDRHSFGVASIAGLARVDRLQLNGVGRLFFNRFDRLIFYRPLELDRFLLEKLIRVMCKPLFYLVDGTLLVEHDGFGGLRMVGLSHRLVFQVLHLKLKME